MSNGFLDWTSPLLASLPTTLLKVRAFEHARPSAPLYFEFDSSIPLLQVQALCPDRSTFLAMAF